MVSVQLWDIQIPSMAIKLHCANRACCHPASYRRKCDPWRLRACHGRCVFRSPTLLRNAHPLGKCIDPFRSFCPADPVAIREIQVMNSMMLRVAPGSERVLAVSSWSWTHITHLADVRRAIRPRIGHLPMVLPVLRLANHRAAIRPAPKECDTIAEARHIVHQFSPNLRFTAPAGHV
jgi:hypothetical protein